MNLSKSLGLMAMLGILIPAPAALASYGNGNSGKPPVEKPPKVEKEKNKDPAYSVPEPATILLLSAAAGAACAGKLWQKRRSSRSVS